MDKSKVLLRDFIIGISKDDMAREDNTGGTFRRNLVIGKLVGYCRSLLEAPADEDPDSGLKVNVYIKNLNQFNITFGNFDLEGSFTVREGKRLELTMNCWYRDLDTTILLTSPLLNSVFSYGYVFDKESDSWKVIMEVNEFGDPICVSNEGLNPDKFYSEFTSLLSSRKFGKHGSFVDCLKKAVGVE